VFVLREVEGYEHGRDGTLSRISEELVKVRLHRAKSRLRERVFTRVDESATEAFEFHASRCDRVVAAVFDRIDALDLDER
jgi:RNA polymerase sigma-70 factor, ECF subfamily